MELVFNKDLYKTFELSRGKSFKILGQACSLNAIEETQQLFRKLYISAKKEPLL